MTRLARLALLCLASVAALAASGCGNKEEFTTVGHTEGIYVTVDELKYQVQISRVLNPASPEDANYLRGIPAGEETLGEDEVWFGVFMRVENDKDEPHESVDEFTIHDTEGTEFEPIDLSLEENPVVYTPGEVTPGTSTPNANSPAYDSTIRGELLLFKLPAASLGLRPLELEIHSATGGENGIIDIDV